MNYYDLESKTKPTLCAGEYIIQFRVVSDCEIDVITNTVESTIKLQTNDVMCLLNDDGVQTRVLIYKHSTINISQPTSTMLYSSLYGFYEHDLSYIIPHGIGYLLNHRDLVLTTDANRIVTYNKKTRKFVDKLDQYTNILSDARTFDTTSMAIMRVVNVVEQSKEWSFDDTKDYVIVEINCRDGVIVKYHESNDEDIAQQWKYALFEKKFNNCNINYNILKQLPVNEYVITIRDYWNMDDKTFNDLATTAVNLGFRAKDDKFYLTTDQSAVSLLLLSGFKNVTVEETNNLLRFI